MNIKYNFLVLSFIAFTGLFMSSCSNDESFDVKGNPDNLIYLKANEDNTFSGVVCHTPIGDFDNLNAAFPILVQRAVTKDTKITAIIDTSLIAAYNKKHETNYVALPSNAIDDSDLSATISAGNVRASDSIKVALKESSLASLTKKGYLLPIRISDVNGDGVASVERGVGYVIVTTETKLIKDITSTDEMVGTLLTDHIGWSADYDNGTDIDISTIFDGSLENGPQLRTDGNNGCSTVVVIDMQSTHDVSGLRFTRYWKSYWGGYWIDEYYFSSVKIELSSDGSTWTEAGTALESSMPKANGYQYVTFYGGVSSRYIRLSIESGGSSVSSLAELGVYTTK